MNPQIVRRTLLKNTNLCEDVIDMIIEFVFPKKFYKNTIYQMYDKNIQDKHEIIPVFISKINKKSVRDQGLCLRNSIYSIPLKDIVEYEKKVTQFGGRYSYEFVYTEKKIDGKLKTSYCSVKDILVYRDDTYLYLSYRYENSHRLLRYSPEEQRIYSKDDKYNRSIYPWDTFDKTKYKFINIPEHLYKFFTHSETYNAFWSKPNA